MNFQIDTHLGYLDNHEANTVEKEENALSNTSPINHREGKREGEGEGLPLDLIVSHPPRSPSSASAAELSHEMKNPPLAPVSPSSASPSSFSVYKMNKSKDNPFDSDHDGQSGGESKGTNLKTYSSLSPSSSTSKSPRSVRELERARTLLTSKLSLSQEAVEGILLAHKAGLVVWSDTLMHALSIDENEPSARLQPPQTPIPPSLPLLRQQQQQQQQVHGDTLQAKRVPEEALSNPQASSAVITTSMMTTRFWQKVTPNSEFKTASEIMRMARSTATSTATITQRVGVSNDSKDSSSGNGSGGGGDVKSSVLMSPVRVSSSSSNIEQESPYRTYNVNRRRL
jgi:hypothetical protein